GDLVLVQGALGVLLGGGGGFFELDVAGAFDAHAFERDARHGAAGGKLAFDLVRDEIWVQVVGPVGMTFRGEVGSFDARIVPASLLVLGKVGPTVFVSPGADATARFAPGLETGQALTLAPAFALG